MDLPEIKKSLRERLPSKETFDGLAKGIGFGLLALTMGAFATPAQSATPPTTEPQALSTARTERQKLVLRQSSTGSLLLAQHESHYSHSSHVSHHSHYSSHYAG